MRVLRSFWIWLVILVATLAFGIPSIFFAFLPPRGDWYLLFARGWAKTLLASAGIRVSVEGREKLSPGASYIYFANHESMADILVLFLVLPGKVRFLAKKSLFRIPILGWSMAAAGFIPVDRENRRSAAASLETAARRLRGGKSVIVFPEQTRTLTGELLPFKKGGVLMALKTQLTIVPVAIAGTFPIIRKGSALLQPGPVAVEIGEPISTVGKAAHDRDALLAASRAAVESLREKARVKLEGSRAHSSRA